MIENLTTNEISDIYQKIYTNENIRDENGHFRQLLPLSEKSDFIEYLTSQVKFLQPKTTDKTVKNGYHVFQILSLDALFDRVLNYML